MPTIRCGEDDLLRLIGKKLDRPRLFELLALAKAEYDGEEDGQLRVEVQDTNRPDLWCVEGIARQIRCYLRRRPARYGFFEDEGGVAGEVEVDPALREIRPAVGAFIARGVKVDESTLVQIIQTQEKLCEGYGHRRREAAMGVYDASAVKFPVHYRAADPDDTAFVPLGFERELSLRTILREHPKGKEYAALVEGYDRFPLLVDDSGTVLSFPPIINSRALGEVEVGDDNLFVEVTGYNMRTVVHVLNIMAVNLADRGFEILPVRAVFPYETALGRQVRVPYDLSRPVDVTVKAVNDLLGVRLSQREVLSLLRRYGVRCSGKGGTVTAVCPPYRLDYMHPCDVIEDVAISRGYDGFRPVMPEAFTVAHLAPLTIFADRVRNELVGYGFQEIFSNILMSREEVRGRLRLEDDEIVRVENFVSETYSVLRDRILPSLLRVEARSTTAAYPHRIFEVGEVAVFDLKDPHGSRTEEHAGALIAANDAGFSQIHSYLDALLYFLARTYKLEARDMAFAIEGRSAAVLVGGKEAGWIAEIHPEVLSMWGIEVPVAAFELNLNALLAGPGGS